MTHYEVRKRLALRKYESEVIKKTPFRIFVSRSYFVVQNAFVLRRSCAVLGSERGQGLLELIIALGLLVTGMTVALALSLANAAAGREAEARAVGANLSREGIEVVQHIRFSNIDLGLNWDRNLDAGSYAAVFDSTSTPPWRLDSITGSNQELRFQDLATSSLFGLRLQGSSTGTATGFLRTITIMDICSDGTSMCNPSANPANPKVGVDVTASVTWQGGGRHTVSTEATYYHWQ